MYIPSNIVFGFFVFTLHFLNYSKVATVPVTLRCLGADLLLPSQPLPPFFFLTKGRRLLPPAVHPPCGLSGPNVPESLGGATSSNPQDHLALQNNVSFDSFIKVNFIISKRQKWSGGLNRTIVGTGLLFLDLII